MGDTMEIEVGPYRLRPFADSDCAAIVEIAQRWSRKGKIYIIEDGAYRELRYYGEDTPSLRPSPQPSPSRERELIVVQNS